MARWARGRPPGRGLEGPRGKVPGEGRGPPRQRDWTCFSAGIGQGYIAVTPIQMANVAATIARGGIWMRPRLIAPNLETGQMPATRAGNLDGPDRVGLPLSPEELKACRLGQYHHVHSRGGSRRRGPQGA